MQCKELEAVLESEGLSPLPIEAREHLAGCLSCQDLLADLSAIVVTAKAIPAEATPPDRIWVSIRAQLEAEGMIRDAEPVAVSASSPWWTSIAEFFRPRVLAAVGAGLFVVVGSIYVMQHHSSPRVATQPQNIPIQAKETAPSNAVVPLPTAPSILKPTPPPQRVEFAHNTPTPAVQPRPSTRELKPAPSENVYLGDSAAVLNETEGALPSRGLSNNAAVDASLRQNLRTINEFIAECEARLKQNPQDQLTREYLNMAYQQKADLLNAMMDSGRSEH
jgi:outer membrane biosynthesis protein TonB